ncbi:alpha-glucosidase [Physcia stellaris]|nr:alpha-glucosidase [Physcia stellaris]
MSFGCRRCWQAFDWSLVVVLIFLSSASPVSESYEPFPSRPPTVHLSALQYSCSSSAWIRHFGFPAKLVFDRALALKPLVGINLPAGIWTRVPLPINFTGLHVQFTARGIVLHSGFPPRLDLHDACICQGTDPPPNGNHADSPPQIVVVIVASFFLLGLIFFYIRSLRYTHPEPRYIPTPFLKSLWRSWKPGTKYGRMFKRKTHTSLSDRNTSYTTSINEPDLPTVSSTEMAATTNGVDRNTSKRPTTKEARREADMEALYQIRQARRREINDREERRRERAAAREAGDWARLEPVTVTKVKPGREPKLGSEANPSTGSLGEPRSSTLIAEHTLRTASRGAVIRADSVESDHRPLLDSAASMGGTNRSAASSRRGSGLFKRKTFHPSLNTIVLLPQIRLSASIQKHKTLLKHRRMENEAAVIPCGNT